MQPVLRNSRGVDCALHEWQPSSPPKAVCVIYHGYASHGKYPTVVYLAELLRSNGIFCMSMDFEGHGVSPGRPGLIYSQTHLADDGALVARHARATHPQLPLFLAGTSMGGAIALNVSRQCSAECSLCGLVLLSPMVKISNPPPTWQLPLLRTVSWFLPGAAVLPRSGLAPEKQYRDPERCAECVADSLSYSGNMRLATAYSCLATAADLHDNLEEVSCPFACFFGTDDVVTDVSGADDLMQRSSTSAADKELKKYEGGLHGLLCEPLPLRSEIENDILAWVQQRMELASM
eukprot:TRINITY_DN81850_c0_g1_i1.p1 TRINITY_DN81850_c0_g1~~TRINITY_DN81850_c0_g1_i1.p1  ORF type:complete len:308 (-),score=30.08 TRINITY_DN81850_c0_g1_i1:167-1039(-)